MRSISQAFVLQIVFSIQLVSICLAQKYTSIWDQNVTIHDACINSNTSTSLNQQITSCPYQKSYLLSSYQSYFYQPFFNITFEESDGQIILNNKGLGNICLKFAEICLENVHQRQIQIQKSQFKVSQFGYLDQLSYSTQGMIAHSYITGISQNNNLKFYINTLPAQNQSNSFLFTFLADRLPLQLDLNYIYYPSEQYLPKTDQYYRIFSQLNTYYVSTQIVPSQTFNMILNGTQYICWNYSNITLDADLDKTLYGISGIYTDNGTLNYVISFNQTVNQFQNCQQRNQKLKTLVLQFEMINCQLSYTDKQINFNDACISQCPDGYYQTIDQIKNIFICSPCDASCNICTGPLQTQCCSSTLPFLYRNQCLSQQPEQSNCKQVNGNLYNCQTCQSTCKNYCDINGECLKTCQITDSQLVCQCENASYYYNVALQQCILRPILKHCISVSQNSPQCLACEQGYLLQQGVCILCQNGKYVVSDNQCSGACPQFCLNCLNSTTCLKYDETLPCHFSCSTCKRPNFADSCTSCLSNTRQLNNQTNSCDCIEGYKETGQQNCEIIPSPVSESLVNFLKQYFQASYYIQLPLILFPVQSFLSYSILLQQQIGILGLMQNTKGKNLKEEIMLNYNLYNFYGIDQVEIEYDSFKLNIITVSIILASVIVLTFLSEIISKIFKSTILNELMTNVLVLADKSLYLVSDRNQENCSSSSTLQILLTQYSGFQEANLEVNSIDTIDFNYRLINKIIKQQVLSQQHKSYQNMEGNKEYRADDDEKQESKSDQEVVQSNKKSQICSEDNKPQDEADELNCGICNKPFSVEYEAFFLFCEHFYHKVCLAKYCNYFVSKKQFPIKCPNSECLQPIKYDDIKQILKYADFKNYVKLTLLNAGDLNCELCNKQMKNFDAIFLTCKHIFHVICLNKYRSKGQSPIKCPNSECSMTLQLDQTEQQKQGCEICYEPMTINNHYLLICEHIFHKVCLAKYCNYFVRKIQFPIKCPNSQCLQHIKYDDIKQILEYADFKNYVKLTLLKSGDLNCELCNKQMKNFDAIFLTCKHIFHVICLFKYRSKGQSPIKCPNSECSMTLQLDQTEQQKYKYFNYPKISLQSIYDQDCEICYEPMTSNNCYLLICKHIYHKVCLSKHCNTLINEKQFPINCPHFKCLIPLQQNEIKKILSEVDFEKYEKFTLQNYIDSNADEFSWCPTPNCQYAFVIDSNQTYLKCPSCEKSYCLTCKCDFHEGQTCKEYQISNQHTEQDGHFEKYVKSLKFKQCLNCKMWVEKTIGQIKMIKQSGLLLQLKNNQIMKQNDEILTDNEEEECSSDSKIVQSNMNNETYYKNIEEPSELEIEDEEEKKNVDKNFKGKKCNICLGQISNQRYQDLQCQHFFHKKCLKKYICDEIAQKNYPINCPDTNCRHLIKQNVLKRLLTQKQFRKCKQISKQNIIDLTYEEFIWCPSVNCQYAQSNENNLTILECPVCKISYCINCRVKQHQGQTCEAYQNSIKNHLEEKQINLDIQLKSDEKKKPDQDSQMLGKQLEQQNLENNQPMMMNYDQADDWVCEICYEPMISNDIFLLICEHIFHKICLSKHCNALINKKQLPINCPHFECLLPLQQNEIKEILSEVDFEKYEKFTLQNYIDSNADEISWCPTPNCEYAFVIDSNQTNFKCPTCKKSYCLTCKCDFHEGQTCKEYQISNKFTEQDEHFEKYVKGQKFKQCLKCKMWVEKTTGCDHMTCRCGYQFCYKCGGPYLKCSCAPGFINPFQIQLINEPNQIFNPSFSMNNLIQQQPSYITNIYERQANQNRSALLFGHQNFIRENNQSNLFQQQMIQTQLINRPNSIFNSPNLMDNQVQQQTSNLPNSQRQNNQNRQIFEHVNLMRENQQEVLFQQQQSNILHIPQIEETGIYHLQNLQSFYQQNMFQFLNNNSQQVQPSSSQSTNSTNDINYEQNIQNNQIINKQTLSSPNQQLNQEEHQRSSQNNSKDQL
ncbi:hypothetical protein ABPG74_007928 [Tetrahymena malaccensis]